MVFDWFAREGWIVISWWLLVTIAGAAVLPLCVRLLGALPDKGYTLARAIGLLLTGYVLWLLGSLGFLQNTTGSILLSWLIVLGIALAVYMRGGERFDWRAWWRGNRPVIITTEILFAVLLLGWALVRAYQPELRSTEKPMDMMFINSIIRSPAFPPNDAWMAGYSISYYYFGYFIAAMLSTASGITGSIGINMMVSMVFALAGVTAFGVVANLVRAKRLYGLPWEQDSNPVLGEEAAPPVVRESHRGAVLAGLLATFMVVLMGNFHTPLIVVPFHSGNVSADYFHFWSVQNFNAQGVTNSNYNWWSDGFWASRIVQDYNLDGTIAQDAQPIDEFPQFSFILADSHPHVMALPFVLLTLGLALNLLLTWREPTRGETIFYGLAVGSLVFLNTWDGPIYIIALVGADGLRRLMRGQGRLSVQDGFGVIRFGVTLVILTVIFYLPFLVSFRSQASGLLPNLITPTYFPQYFIAFGPFILILAFFLWGEVRAAGNRMNWKFGLQTAGALFLALLLVMIALMLVALLIPELSFVIGGFANQYGGLLGALPLVIKRRLETLLTSLVLLAGLVFVVGRLFPRRLAIAPEASRDERQVVTYSRASAFALMAVALGLGLTLVPEFFYLRDNFGSRINTIFKFYYQAWVVFSIASAYAVYVLLTDKRLLGTVARAAFAVVATVVIGAGSLYPIMSIYTHALADTGYLTGSNTTPLTLNGENGFIADTDVQAINCFKTLTAGSNMVVSEAVGGPYNPAFGRVAALTGIPTVIGWTNHEQQWRGSTYGAIAGSRADDIPRLYQDLRWEVAQEIIQRYNIDYIFYGSSERDKYSSAGEDKFRENLQPVCSVTDASGRVQSVFYWVNHAALQAAAK